MRSQKGFARSKVFTFLFTALGSLAAGQALAAPTLFVGTDSGTGTINGYTLPITASSTPAFTLNPGNPTVAVGVDSAGNVMAGSLGGTLTYFPSPLTGSPSASFADGASISSGQIAFLPNGNVWVGSVALQPINHFAPPFTNASVPASTLAPPGVSIGLTFDAALNLYAADSGRIFVFPPPYTGAPAVTTATVAGFAYRKMAVSGSQLFVPTSAPGTGAVEVYNLPLTAASVPAFQIATGTNFPEAIAFDVSGNMYVGNLGSSSVTVYSPPFTAASAPNITLNIPAFAIFSLAIGNTQFAPPAPPAGVPALDPSKLLALCVLLLGVGLLALRVRRKV
jgi:hypothetical protein